MPSSGCVRGSAGVDAGRGRAYASGAVAMSDLAPDPMASAEAPPRRTDEPVARARSFHAIVEQIRSDIFQRRLTPGDRLPRERALAEEFGVSRAGVREALRVLEHQGLVRVYHGYKGGSFVAEAGAGSLVGALETSLRQAQVGVADLYAVRRLLEPPLARTALERDAVSLERLLDQNVARAAALAGDGARPFAVNLEFHAVISSVAGNPVAQLMMRALVELLEGREREVPAASSVSSEAVDDHRLILEAVRARDGRLVEALMTTHLAHLESRFSTV